MVHRAGERFVAALVAMTVVLAAFSLSLKSHKPRQGRQDGQVPQVTLYPLGNSEGVCKRMDFVSEQVRPIEGRQLTTWTVMPGGTRIRLEFAANDGTIHRIVLPFDALTGLLMTLPRMLQTALDARFADGSLRFVQRLGRWALEQAESDAGLILKLGTRNGFEVAFALNGEDAGSLGTALLAAPNDTNQLKIRRPH
jgi:hypothetical protein